MIHEPSLKVCDIIILRLEELTNEKFQKVQFVYLKYVETLKMTDKHFDKNFPINIISMDSSSIDGASSQSNLLPWKAVLSPQIHDGQIDYDYLSA
jgi:hypothetical protein